MATGPPGQGTPQPRPTFSPDGLWWWDGAQWRPAVSPDRMWRWNGQAWEPNRPPAAATSGATTAVVVILAFVGVILLVSIFAGVVLYTMGSQISNVFSNVAAALGSSPSP